MTEPPEDLAAPDELSRGSILPGLVERLISHVHWRNAMSEIGGPNPNGVFPNSTLRSVPPVVADANVLRGDVLRSCKQKQHTVLVASVNAGMIRLFCAEHVVSEVEQHAEKWSVQGKVPLERFLATWKDKYLPLLRVVAVVDSLLSPGEQTRIDLLDHGPRKYRDPDDVPSATLALQLGAFFLSTDRKALKAVYGPDVDLARHDNWLAVLKLGGNAGASGQLSQSLADGSLMVGGSVFLALRWVWENLSPWVAVAAVGAGGYALYRTSPETRHNAVDAATSLMTGSADLRAWYVDTTADFLAAAPTIPAWGELAALNGQEATLERACLHTLARSPMTDRSAAELSNDLGVDLPVAHGQAKVRAVLREKICFEPSHRGRWQVGYYSPLRVGTLTRNGPT